MLLILDGSPLVARLRAAALGEAAGPAAIDDAELHGAAGERAVAGASEALEGLDAILGALGAPGDWVVNELNPAAGAHAVPGDLREVEAALLAGEACWREIAYYGARYGERGRRFTGSDAAWLVTLARDDLAAAMKQIDWLARLLAARGMPRWLLERHLQQLERTLGERLPQRASRYATLGAAAAALRAERLAAIPDDRAEALIARFTQGLETERGITPREAATLVVAAAADEACGVTHAARGLTRWLADPDRFSRKWRTAMEKLLAAARDGKAG
jgi:hypothetical protein